jgi:hypothetical protein
MHMKKKLMKYDGFRQDFHKIGMNDASSLLFIMPPKWFEKVCHCLFSCVMEVYVNSDL